MQDKSVTPCKFRPLQIQQSPVTTSPNRNLTGSARIARDIAADIFNAIQNWNRFHIEGAQVVKQIGVIKAESIHEYSSDLEESTNNLYIIIQDLKLYVDQLYRLKNQISALNKLDKRQEPMFISLRIEDIVSLVENVVDGYLEEFKIKELVLENIAHSKNKDELMFFAACWTHQPNITSQINFKLECLLTETGHRKVS